MRQLALAGILATFSLAAPAGAAERPAEKGPVRFRPVGDQRNIPERYRLDAHEFDYQLTFKQEAAEHGVTVYQLRFPSPVTSPHPENNIVHAEYFRPAGAGPFPGVVVLDIMGGDQNLSRVIASLLAQNRIAALFVQMAYYGPRRPPGSNIRLVSPDYFRTMDGIRQTVLDVRRATAWLEARPEIDPKRLGLLGTSLGSFIGTLAAEMEPKLGRVVNIVGGGGLVDGYYDHPKAEPFRQLVKLFGGSKERIRELVAPVDPLTCAANLEERKFLMIAARRDDVVPPRMAEALWAAAGKQKIIWYDCTHVGAIVYLVPAMQHAIKHFTSE